MSAIAPPLIAPRVPRERARDRDPRLHGVSAVAVMSLMIGGVAFAGYAWLGDRVVVQQHLLTFDAASRLAHAFFVFYDAPPKLAAIGFVWAPISTLVYLPLAVIKPLATSMLALPLTSAVFGAGIVIVLHRTLALLRIRWYIRAGLLLAFALNPMIAFYATNGMSEIVALFFLMTGIHLLLRWYLSRDSHFLVLSSLPFMFAMLTRYELVAYAAVATVIVWIVLRGRVVSRDKRESAVIGFLAPIFYGVGLWVFFNWLILGDPLFWLRNQAPGAGGQQAGQVVIHTIASLSLSTIFSDVVSVNWQLFPMTVVMIPIIVWVWLRKRDAMSACLLALLLVNPLTTSGLMLISHQVSFLQLRYNMRTIPIAIVAAAWAIHSLATPRARAVAGIAAVIGVAASLPATWHAMQSYRFQYEEAAFVKAISTGKSLEGTYAYGGYYIGVDQERQMANYIVAHVHRTNDVLTDDALSLEVMLFSGHPNLFYDRIDHGDAAWKRVLDAPFGKVHYFLISTFEHPTLDYIQLRYPQIPGGLPWAHVVFANGRYELLAIPSCPPAGRARGLVVPPRCSAAGRP